MSALTRNNGTQFVIQAYRERLSFKTKAQLTQTVRDIAAQQGQFVQLLEYRFNEYEAVFSNTPGYLLGESIKHYFQQLNNLVFIESTSDKHAFLFVVIKAGHVFVDSLMSLDSIKTELLPLTILDTKFQVILSGNLPSDVSDVKQGFFPEKIIDTIQHIKEPLLPHLPTSADTKLMPLPLALRSKQLSKNTLITKEMVNVLLTRGLTGLLLYFHQRSPHEENNMTLTRKKISVIGLTTTAAIAMLWQASHLIGMDMSPSTNIAIPHAVTQPAINSSTATVLNTQEKSATAAEEQANEASYLTLRHQYRFAKLQHQLLEEQLIVANMQQQLNAAQQDNPVARQEQQTTSDSATTHTMLAEAYPQLVYLDHQANKWSATLVIDNEYQHVIAGSLLRNNIGYVTAVNRDGVMITAQKQQYKLSFDGIALQQMQ